MRLIDTDLETAKIMKNITFYESRIGLWEGKRNQFCTGDIDAIIKHYRGLVREARSEIDRLREYTVVTLDETKENPNG